MAKRPTKTLTFDDSVLDILRDMEWAERECGLVGTLTCGQLDRNMYLAVNKALEAMGGKWNRKEKGHIFPVDPREEVDGLLDTGSLEVVKDGYFPTPAPLAHRMFEIGRLSSYFSGTILEPSAGTGELATEIASTFPTASLVVGELNHTRQDVLRDKGFTVLSNRTDGGFDFLSHFETYDCIFQNPPFEVLQDIEHVYHAYDCLVSGGLLVSIMSLSAFQQVTGKATEFRYWLNTVGGKVRAIARGEFADSGTMVGGKIVRIERE